MRDPNKRLPALVFAALLLTAGAPVLSGGRDVPDNIAEGSSSSHSSQPEVSCSGDAITRVSMGGVSMDVVTAPNGSITLQPTLIRQAGQLLKRVLYPDGAPDDSCSNG